MARLSPGVKFAQAEPFVPKRWSDLQEYKPNVIAGTFSEMQRLIEHAGPGSGDEPVVDRALVVLTRFGVNPLNDVARVTLWQTFGVPIFELYLGLDDSLLASECEAHEGWHLAAGVEATTLEAKELILEGAGNNGLRTGLAAHIERDVCPCGLTTPRVLEIEPLGRREERYAAVSA